MDLPSLLSAHGIRPTANRTLVVRCLADSHCPLTQGEIERRLVTLDKSGVSRALAVLRAARLVHIIEGGDEGVRYELCHCAGHSHDTDRHPHFYCESCRRTFCLDTTPMPDIALPDGFMPASANYIIRGLCPECAQKHSRLK